MDWIDAFIAGVVAGLAVAAVGKIFMLESVDTPTRLDVDQEGHADVGATVTQQWLHDNRWQ